MNKLLHTLFVLCNFLIMEAQVKLSTNFFDVNYKKELLHDAWQIANDISPMYEGNNDEPQIRPDMKMNIIRLSGGIKKGSGKNLEYDMVKWSDGANDFVYDFTRLINVIDKANKHNDEIYQLVIDNVPWCFQRGYNFVDLDKNSFDGVHFRKFEEIEQYGNALPPSDMYEYGEYVEALFQTLVDTYGMEQVKKWRFRIGSEIESPGHWKGSAEDFVKYFDVSIRAIRKIVPEAHVGIHIREPNYKAISHKGLNYKGQQFVSFHNDILEHCYNNNLHINSLGLSYYIQFDKEGEFHTNETWYNERVSPFLNHPKWNKETEINLEEFKATASFRAPDGRFATLKSGSSHGEVAHIAMSNLFYKHSELNQLHRWLQYKNTKDGIANQELLAMVGKTRYETIISGTPDNPSNQIDAIFAKDEEKNTYEALIYNYNDTSLKYESPQIVNLSFVTQFPAGTKFQYRSSYYTKSHNKLQSFVNESYFQESWYLDGIKEGQKLGEAERVLKNDIYNSLYKPYKGHQKYNYSDWKNITTLTSLNDNNLGSEIKLQTNLHSFAFKKFEFRPIE